MNLILILTSILMLKKIPYELSLSTIQTALDNLNDNAPSGLDTLGKIARRFR